MPNKQLNNVTPTWRYIVQLLIWHQLSKLVVQILSLSSFCKLLPYTIACKFSRSRVIARFWSQSKKTYLPELMTINLTSSPANRALLLAVSSRSWLAVIPSRGLILAWPEEFQVVLRWWLGMDTSLQLRCPYCPDHQLDPHVTCKGGGDVFMRHNALRDVFPPILS